MNSIFSRISISAKLMIVPIFIIIVLGIIGSITLRGLGVQSENFTSLYHQFKFMHEGNQLVSGIERAHLNLYKSLSWYTTGYDQKRIDSLVSTIFSDIDLSTSTIRAILDNKQSDISQQQALLVLTDSLKSYRTNVAQVIDMAETDISLTTTMVPAVEIRMQKMQEFFDLLWEKSLSSGKSLNSTMEKRCKRITSIFITFVVLSVLVLLSVSFLIGKWIKTTIHTILGTLTTLSSGNLTHTCRLDGNDELLKIGSAIDTTIVSLRELILGLMLQSKKVTDAAARLRTTATSLSQNAEAMTVMSSETSVETAHASTAVTSIASGAEHLTVAMTTMSGAIEEMSITLNEVANNCQKELQQTLKARELTSNTSVFIDRLGKATVNVGKVTDLIYDISDRINLLALNATIEAASAGEAGKGFAVVASEVKDLSRQAAAAVKQIEEQIGEIQNTMQTVVESNSTIGNVIAEITSISQSIVTVTEEQNATVSEIAKNMTGISTQTKSIADNVTSSSENLKTVATRTVEMNKSVENTTATSVEIAATGNHLSALAVSLEQSIDRFTL